MCMKALQLAGQIIMENGGEAYRVEETVTRMGQAFGLKNVESFAVPSGVFVSYEREDGTHETAVLRVHRRGINLTRVDAVNQISRQAEHGEINAAQALHALEHIANLRVFAPHQLVVAAGVSACAWSVMFGGGVPDFFIGFLIGVLVELLNQWLGKHQIHSFMATLVCSFFATLIPQLLCHLLGTGSPEAYIAGALMPLLPGLSMTNAVHDTMRGDIVSGASHGLSAVLCAGMIAGGALSASSLFHLLIGGLL